MEKRARECFCVRFLVRLLLFMFIFFSFVSFFPTLFHFLYRSLFVLSRSFFSFLPNDAIVVVVVVFIVDLGLCGLRCCLLCTFSIEIPLLDFFHLNEPNEFYVILFR